MNNTMQQPGTAGKTVVDTTKPTLEEVLLCVHDCVHTMKADSYGRAYRRFVTALAEAHSELTVEDINQVIEDCDDALADNHVGECDEGGESGGETVLEQITPDLAAVA